mgnify:CR=1 FL=1
MKHKPNKLLNEYHQQQSKKAVEAVAEMMKTPYTIEQAQNQVRSLNAQYKASLEAETQENEKREREAVFSSPFTRDRDIYLSLVDKDFEIISEVLDTFYARRKEEYTFERQEDLDSGSIRYKYLSQKAKQKSVIISRNTERRIIVNCIRNQMQINSGNDEYLSVLIEKLLAKK